jgi:hypothetical protein
MRLSLESRQWQTSLKLRKLELGSRHKMHQNSACEPEAAGNSEKPGQSPRQTSHETAIPGVNESPSDSAKSARDTEMAMMRASGLAERLTKLTSLMVPDFACGRIYTLLSLCAGYSHIEIAAAQALQF